MALTPSSMLALGTPAPDFRLLEPRSGEYLARDDFAEAAALVVVFMCNHCPYVKHIRHELARLGQDFAKMGVAMVGINSNDIERYPADGPDAMVQQAHSAGYSFPYLLDATQEVAKAYSATCTPDFFVFDRDRKLVYRGQLDDSRPGNAHPVTGHDVRAAVAALLQERAVSPEQRPSIGCNIKWKPGNAPP